MTLDGGRAVRQVLKHPLATAYLFTAAVDLVATELDRVSRWLLSGEPQVEGNAPLALLDLLATDTMIAAAWPRLSLPLHGGLRFAVLLTVFGLVVMFSSQAYRREKVNTESKAP